MPVQTKEASILLAIQALQTTQNLSVQKAAKLYNVPETSLRTRIKGRKPMAERWPKVQLLDELEEKALVQHI
ncbi:hypothetical protein V502_03982, partial [Pseudogymnoascus sp. VKM F-4520 (FW-2644)]